LTAGRVSGRSASDFAGIAQLVEHQLPKLRVAGSNPVSRSSSTAGNSAGFSLEFPA
jgi:hypothetical protein